MPIALHYFSSIYLVKNMPINFGVNYPIDSSGHAEEFIKESGADFLVVPSEENVAERQRKNNEYDYRSITNKVDLFMRDYTNGEVERSQEYFEDLSNRLINSARLGGSGFFAPHFTDDEDVYDPLFRTIFSNSSPEFDVVFPFWDHKVFYEVFNSIHPSKFKIHVQPSELVNLDDLNHIYENMQFLSFPLIRNGNLDSDIDEERYFEIVEKIYYGSFYDDIYVFIHIVPDGGVKDQANNFKKAKRDISTVLETIIGEEI